MRAVTIRWFKVGTDLHSTREGDGQLILGTLIMMHMLLSIGCPFSAWFVLNYYTLTACMDIIHEICAIVHVRTLGWRCLPALTRAFVEMVMLAFDEWPSRTLFCTSS